MAERHHFKLKLPNGAEVDFGGDKDFVLEVYRDTKAAAVTLFNREAARTTPESAVDRLLSPADQDLRVVSTAPAPVAALPSAGAAQSLGTPASSGNGDKPRDDDKKARKTYPKPDEAQKVAKNARKNEIATILHTAAFDEDALYAGAIKTAGNALDRACLVVCLARDKFGMKAGLRPAEVIQILNDRFRVGQEKSALKKAMKDAPSSIFVDGPADFDKAARLYRAMSECDDKVIKMLDAQRNPRSEPNRLQELSEPIST